jgi:hypothetical protein
MQQKSALTTTRPRLERGRVAVETDPAAGTEQRV